MLAAALIVLPRQILAPIVTLKLRVTSSNLSLAAAAASNIFHPLVLMLSSRCDQGKYVLSPRLLTLWVFPPTRLTHCYIFVVLWIFCCEVASWLPGSNRFWVVFQAGVLSPFQVTSSSTNLLPLSGLWRDKERI